MTLAVGGLAVHRATRLVTDDTITAPVRDRIVDRGGWPADLVTCPWCVSVWVAAGWAALTVAAPRVARPLGALLAWSSIAGLLAAQE